MPALIPGCSGSNSDTRVLPDSAGLDRVPSGEKRLTATGMDTPLTLKYP